MKKIKLNSSYRGAPSRERVIPAGEYAASDERLFGLAEYLVKTGHAVVTEAAPVDSPSTDDEGSKGSESESVEADSSATNDESGESEDDEGSEQGDAHDPDPPSEKPTRKRTSKK